MRRALRTRIYRGNASPGQRSFAQLGGAVYLSRGQNAKATGVYDFCL